MKKLLISFMLFSFSMQALPDESKTEIQEFSNILDTMGKNIDKNLDTMGKNIDKNLDTIGKNIDIISKINTGVHTVGLFLMYEVTRTFDNLSYDLLPESKGRLISFLKNARPPLIRSLYVASVAVGAWNLKKESTCKK